MSEARRARIAQRKANRQCVQCGAGLQETDKVLCVECVEIREKSRAKYERENPERARAVKKGKKPKPRTPPDVRRADYAQRLKDGRCVVHRCPRPRAPDAVRCLGHLKGDRRSSLAYERRKVWPRIVAKNLTKAALEGATGVEGSVIRVFFPDGGYKSFSLSPENRALIYAQRVGDVVTIDDRRYVVIARDWTLAKWRPPYLRMQVGFAP